MAAKYFEVGDVLPATTQLRISWTSTVFVLDNEIFIETEVKGYTDFIIMTYYGTEEGPEEDIDYYYVSYFDISLLTEYINIGGHQGLNNTITEFNVPFTESGGNHAYVDIDTSTWSLGQRTIASVVDTVGLQWEDMNPPSGYSIAFKENGGTSVTDLTEQTALPSPLPTTTKDGHVFVAWYLDSMFTQKAVAGATVESNVTLYAKWYSVSGWFSDVADSIREKEGTIEPIRKVDFPERIANLPSPKEEQTKTVTPDFSSGNVVVTPTSGKVMTQVTVNKDSNLIANNIKKDVTVHGVTGSSFIAVELTQAQYDALGTKDSNTYYLIVEV